MIAFSIGAVRLRGWNLSDFGLNLKNWRYNLNLGIVWGILSPIALLFALLLTGGYRLRVSHPGEAPWNLALLASCMAIASSLLLLLMLSRRRAALAATPPTASIPALLVLWSLPALAALLFHRPFGHMVGVLGWMIVGAGLGEEIFFRGYVQTRLDLAFGRPVAFAGVRFGMGLIVSSMLFGLVHALNTVDYFHGQFHFNWPLGFVECFEGAVFAIMREETGSVFPGAIAHGLGDVLTRIPG